MLWWGIQIDMTDKAAYRAWTERDMGMVSVVVPCYNEEKMLPAFYQEFCKVRESMQGIEFELVFVDDGSMDQTLRFIKELAYMDASVVYISFSRNFGKEAAIYAGLEACRGDFAVIMDADLQDPPTLLPQMYNDMEAGQYDAVAARRIGRKGEPLIRSFFARQFYKLMKRVSDIDLVDGARDYRMMNRKYVDAVLSLREYNRFSKGLFGWVGFRTKWLEYENIKRAAGETKWSFWKLFVYAVDGIAAFTTMPLTISAFAGALLSFLAFAFMAYVVIKKLIFGNQVAGWASTTALILFVNGIQMFFTGIVGLYLARTYLEVKHRPIYIEKESNRKGKQEDDGRGKGREVC